MGFGFRRAVRDRLGVPVPRLDSRVSFEGFVALSRSVALSPERFYSRLPRGGGYATPVAFALGWGLIAHAVGGFWNFVVSGSPPVFFVATLLCSPLVVITNLALFACAVHLLVRRSIGGESAGFGATFVACCYASVANVLCVVPFFGLSAAGIWFLFLVAAGVGLLHFEEATYVRMLGWAHLLGAFVAFWILKVMVIGLLYGSVVGLVLTGAPAGSGEAESDAIFSVVMPASGVAYNR